MYFASLMSLLDKIQHLTALLIYFITVLKVLLGFDNEKCLVLLVFFKCVVSNVLNWFINLFINIPTNYGTIRYFENEKGLKKYIQCYFSRCSKI